MEQAGGEVEATSWVIHAVAPSETWPLRQRVLRPHQTLEELVVDGEYGPLAGWYAASVSGEVVGCAGVLPEPRQNGPRDGWRLRSMATAPEVRGLGVGQQLLLRCCEHVAGHGGSSIWCTARVHAAGFYLAHGFHSVGDAFDIVGIGPHLLMEADVDGLTAAGRARRS